MQSLKSIVTIFFLFVFFSGNSQDTSNPMEGEWTIAPIQGALAVGPNVNDLSWFQNTLDDVSKQSCFFDDTYIFEAGTSSFNEEGHEIWTGVYKIITDGSTWLESWQGVNEAQCGEPVAPHDSSDPNGFYYEVNTNTGAVTLIGQGAYFGLAKVTNDGEFGGEVDIADVPTSRTYTYIGGDLALGGFNSEDQEHHRTFMIDYRQNVDGEGVWVFVLAKKNTIPEVNFFVDNNPILENHDVTVRAELSAAVSYDITIDFTPSGSAEFNTDYKARDRDASNLAILIPAGYNSGELIISAIEDGETEDNETIILTPSSSDTTLNFYGDIIITIEDWDWEGNDTNAPEYQSLVAIYESTDGANWNRPWNLNAPYLEWEGVESTCYDTPEWNGSYSYVTTSTTTTNISGEVEINVVEGGLDFSDWSFGLYKNIYGAGKAEGDFKMSTCSGELEIYGDTDTYGDKWEFDLSINGDELTIVWENYTYEDGLENGTTVIQIPDLASKISEGRGIVTGLNLEDNNLTGSLSSEIGNLKDLQWLQLSDNKLDNEGLSFLDSLTNLDYLSLRNNLFSGTISSENLKSIRDLDLSENQFTGSIPVLEGDQESSFYPDHYNISNNNFTGGIPPEFFRNGSNFQEIDISNNEGLTGSIPNEIKYLRNLNFFKFDGTNLCQPEDPSYQQWVFERFKYDDGREYISNNVFCEIPSINLSVNFSSRSNGDAAIVSATLSEMAYNDVRINITPSGTAQLGIDYDLLGGIQTVFGDPVTVIDSTRFPSDSTGNNIWGMAIDSDGNIYVSDYGSSVVKYAPGEAVGEIVAGGNGVGSELNQLNRPRGIALDSEGNLYVADYANFRVTKWVPGASEGVVVAGGYGADSIPLLQSPRDVFVDNLGNLYVAHFDSGGVVTKWASGASEGEVVAGGNGSGEAPNQLNALFGGLLVDATGNVYVSDYYNYRIQKWAPGASEGITIAGGNGWGSAPDQLDAPYDFALGPEGDLYISDRWNNRIQVWEPGSSEGYTLFDGRQYNGSSTQTQSPVSLVLAPNGNLYIGDTNNDRVLELVLSKSSGMMIRRGASQGHMTVSVPEAPSIIDAKSIVLTGDVSSGETMGPEDEVLISLYDGTPLTMKINASNADGPVLDGTVTDDKSLTVTFSTNRATDNFDLEDVTSVGGGFITLSPLSDMIYTGIFQPYVDSDTISISVLTSAFTDTLGNDNDASNQFNWIYDGNDEPVILAFNCTFPENIANGSIVGVIEAMDPDGDVLSYAITSGNENGIFELDSNTGELKVLDNTLLDFELNPTLELMIEVSDGLSTTGATLNIILTDVLNEDDDETTLSISEAAHMIFPNPSNGIINIQMPEFKKATIYTLAGKKVLSSNELRTDISDLGKGVYIIKLEDLNGTSMTTKLVRE